MKFACTSCGQHLEIDETFPSAPIICPNCNRVQRLDRRHQVVSSPVTPTTASESEPGGTTSEPLDLFVVSGITTAIGCLFLFVYALVRREHLEDGSAVIKSAGASMAISIGAIVVAARLQGVICAWIEAAFGVLLLFLGASLAGHIGLPEGLKILFGGAPVLNFGLIMVVIVVGLLAARRHRQGGTLARYSLGVVSVVAAVSYLVQFLVLLADGPQGTIYLSQVVRGGDVILILYAVIVYTGLLTILGCGIADCWINRNIGMLYKAGLSAAWMIIGLLVGLTLMLFVLNLSKENIGAQILAFVLGIVGIITPVVGAVCLCVKGICDGMTFDQKAVGMGAYRRYRNPVPHPVDNSTPAIINTVSPLEQKLRDLQNLQRQGLSTEDEYQAKKRELLGQM